LQAGEKKREAPGRSAAFSGFRNKFFRYVVMRACAVGLERVLAAARMSAPFVEPGERG
jgi:hypothetical protein